jgi:hypothetical protein
MRHSIFLLLLAALAGGAIVAPARAASTLCVGPKAGCYAAIQVAVNAASDGDTITIMPGTYAGGVTVDVSIKLKGAGADKTMISGGGPVLTLGQLGAPGEPTVSIEGVTITGGINTSIPSTFRTRGGGIWVPHNADFSGGATVTIKDSVVTRNSVAPTSTSPSPSGVICPGGGFCPFALAAGGGIYNDGTMTLENTTVSDNEAGSSNGVASDTDGGGIFTGRRGSLTLKNSAVIDNSATAVSPNARFAEGGGIFGDSTSTLTIKNSSVNENATVLQSTFPFFLGGGQTLDMNSNGGGIHVGDDVPVVITDSHIDGNSISVTDPNGEPLGFDAGICVCTDKGTSTLTMRNSTISGNSVDVTVGSSADSGGSGSALEYDGWAMISNSRISDNRATVNAPNGGAIANGGVASFNQTSEAAVIKNTLISGNTATASSTSGSATVEGGGLVNNGPLLVQNTSITRNTGTGTGPGGTLQGGGIFNGDQFFPGGPLTLSNSHVTGNILTGGSGFTLQGGGLYTPGFAVTLDHSAITGNSPDQCFGC